MVVEFSFLMIIVTILLLIPLLVLATKDVDNKKKTSIGFEAFKSLEKELGRFYNILEIEETEEERNAFKEVGKRISYDNYIEEIETIYEYDDEEDDEEENEDETDNIGDEIPGDEKDYVEGYENFQDDSSKVRDLEFRYVSKFRRNSQNVYIYSYNEKSIDGDLGEVITDIGFAIAVKVDETKRFHIVTKDIFNLTTNNNFDELLESKRKIIERETYERGNEFVEIDEDLKKFLVNIYTKYQFKYAIVLQNGELRVRVFIPKFRIEADTIPRLANCIHEILEYYI